MDSLASPFTESKDLLLACATDLPSVNPVERWQRAGRSTPHDRALARSCSARDDKAWEGRTAETNGMRRTQSRCKLRDSSSGSEIGGWQVNPEQTKATVFSSLTEGSCGMVSASAGGRFCGTA